MKKVLLLLLPLLMVVACARAVDMNSKDLLSLISLTPATATPDRITGILGKPALVEEGKRKTVWSYNLNNSVLTLSWDKKTAMMEKFSFRSVQKQYPVFDDRIARRLRSGITNITQAYEILGTPKDMTMKKMTQEMHYAYHQKVLRLFFRNRTLVDYTLY